MSNTNLTIDMITKKGLAMLHDKLTFIGTVNRQYDNSFAQSGAKIGSSRRIRKPAQFLAGSGATATVQAKDDQYTTLNVADQYHVLVDFTSAEMTMDIDSFAQNILDPAMATLASKAEEFALGVAYAGVGGAVVGTGTSSVITWKDAIRAGALLDTKTTPRDNNRHFLVHPLTQTEVLDNTKGLFQDSSQISTQYRDGYIGRTGGFNWAMNSRGPIVTNPADVAGTMTSNYTAGSTSLPLSGLGASKTYPAGTVVSVALCGSVHPETKQATGLSHQFVAKTAFDTDSSGVGIMTVDAVYATGARQNVTALPLSGAVATLLGVTNGSYRQNLAYHRDFFTFATADLELPPVKNASRQVMDGISLRFAEQWDATYDKIVKRFDILVGGAVLRPEYGVKLWEPNV